VKLKRKRNEKKEMIFTSEMRHEWFQTEQTVTLSVFARSIIDHSVEFRTDSVKINADGDVLELALFDLIDPEKSSFKVIKNKIELTLVKKTPQTRWPSLQSQQTPVQDAPPAYPSSAKKKCDWNAVERQIETEKPDEKQLNEFFQDLFKDASDETKMAMKKSYIESNGTCLSTNWNEVSKKKVEVTPPEGMVAKPYEK
jgi:suppressor of G2 allele of SKP1